MLPYVLLLLLPTLCALSNTRRLSLPLWYFTYFVFVLFVGLRLEVGPDWYQYVYIHEGLEYKEFWEVIAQPEPLSYLLFWLSQTSGAGVHLTNILAAIIMLSGVFAFARRTVNPWLALVSATPYFIIVMGMSGVRQAMAAGVILFLFAWWERYSFIRRGFYILIAAMFHTSALINNIFLIVKLSIPLRYKLVIGSVITAITLYLSFEVSFYAQNMEMYQQRYLQQNSLVAQSIGSLYHIVMIAIPAILGFVYRRRIADLVHNQSLLTFGLYAAIGVFALNFFSSTVASRLTLYLYFVPMMVYPALTIGRNSRLPRSGSVLAVLALHFAILVGWFALANVSFTYMPYKNILIDD